MADVFISYKSERRAAAEHLAEILADYGYSVWWDYGLVSGRDFGAQIEAELRAAKAVIVLWCSQSVASEWVREEASLAKRLDKVVPTFIESVDLPLGFSLSQTLDLSDWDGAPQSNRLERLLRDVGAKVGRPPRPNLEGLDRTERAWRRFGAPSLREFALIDAIERQVPPRTLPGALMGEARSARNHSPSGGRRTQGLVRVGIGFVAAALLALFVFRFWYVIVPLLFVISLGAEIGGDRLGAFVPRPVLAVIRFPGAIVWRFLTGPRWRIPRRVFVGLVVIAGIGVGGLFAFPYIYRLIEGAPLAAVRLDVREVEVYGAPVQDGTQLRFLGALIEGAAVSGPQLVVANTSGITAAPIEGFACAAHAFQDAAQWISANKLFLCGRIIDAATSQAVNPVWQGPADLGSQWSASADGRRMVVWSDLNAAVFDTSNGVVTATDLGEPAIWTAARFSPSANSVALTGRPDTVRVWDLTSNAERFRLDVAHPIRGLFLSPDDEVLYYVQDGYLNRVQMLNGEARQMEIPTDLRPLGNPTFFLGGARALFRANEAESGRCEYLVLDTVASTWLSHDLTCSDTYANAAPIVELPGGYVMVDGVVLRADNLEPPEWLSLCGQYSELQLSTDGARVACAADDGRVAVFSTGGGLRIAQFDDSNPLPILSTPIFRLSPDGQKIATLDVYGIVRVRDVATGRVLHRFAASQRRGYSVEFLSFDANWELVAMGDGAQIEVWSLRGGSGGALVSD